MNCVASWVENRLAISNASLIATVIVLAGTDRTRVTIELHDERGAAGVDAVLEYVRESGSFSQSLEQLNSRAAAEEECLDFGDFVLCDRPVHAGAERVSQGRSRTAEHNHAARDAPHQSGTFGFRATGSFGTSGGVDGLGGFQPPGQGVGNDHL